MEKYLNPSSLKQFVQLIDQSERIILTCHVHPDGDAIGSTLGLWHLLKSLGKQPAVVVPDVPPRSLRFLPDFNEIAVYTRHDPYCTRLVEESDLIICCDFNKPSRQDHLAPLIQGAKAPKILIDHHEGPDMDCILASSGTHSYKAGHNYFPLPVHQNPVYSAGTVLSCTFHCTAHTAGCSQGKSGCIPCTAGNAAPSLSNGSDNRPSPGKRMHMRRRIPARSDSQDTTGQAWNLPAGAVTGACMTGQAARACLCAFQNLLWCLSGTPA